MNVEHWFDALHREAQSRAYILFVQIYRNDLYDTTNLVVLYGGRRIYARDQLGGRWHRHTAEAPDVHDTSADGSRSVELAEFLDEAEAVLAAMDLP